MNGLPTNDLYDVLLDRVFNFLTAFFDHFASLVRAFFDYFTSFFCGFVNRFTGFLHGAFVVIATAHESDTDGGK
jgi:hypothetical protein